MRLLLRSSSRRTFIFMGAAAGLALAIPAPIEIFQLPDIPKAVGGVGGFSLAEANRILKEIYLPVVTKQLENQTLLLKYMEKEEPECSYCGAALLNNQTDCPKCGGTTRRKDFLGPDRVRQGRRVLQEDGPGGQVISRRGFFGALAAVAVGSRMAPAASLPPATYPEWVGAGLTYNGLPIVADRECLSSRVFFTKDFDWMGECESSLLATRPSKARPGAPISSPPTSPAIP
jgi:hypothetical protein